MVAPLIAAAGISAASSLFSGITGGKGAKKAAKIAAQSAAADRAQALQIYNTNMGLAQPTVDRGNAAGSQINALLGLGGDTAAANDALATWRNSTGYQTGLDAGLSAVNTGYAAKGALESGAAQKALQKAGTDYSNQNFGQHYGMLSGQQSAGLGALGAVTGAGNTYAAQISNANSSQSSAQANAAIFNAMSQQNALAGVANAAGQYFGRSGQPTSTVNALATSYAGRTGGLYDVNPFG